MILEAVTNKRLFATEGVAGSTPTRPAKGGTLARLGSVCTVDRWVSLANRGGVMGSRGTGSRITRGFRRVWLVVALSMLASLLSTPSASADVYSCYDISNHCYSILYQQTHQYSGMSGTQNRAHLYTALPAGYGYFINSEYWYSSHCFGSYPWVETGLSAGYKDGSFYGYVSFWAAGKPSSNFYHEHAFASLAQGATRDQAILQSNGNGTFYVQYGGSAATSDNVGLTLGSCLEQGSEIWSNDATAATFTMNGSAFSTTGATIP